MTGLRLHDPILLLALVPLAVATIYAARRRRRFAVLYSSLDALRTLPVTWAQRVRRFLPAVRVLGLALLVLALARPQRGREEFRVRTEGIAIEMVLDRSGSMQALDFEEGGERASRMEVAKRVFRDFVAGNGDALPGRPDDLIGLVTFGGFAEGRCPLTLDHGALLKVLEPVDVPKPLRDARGRVLNRDTLEEESATAIGDALVLGAERLQGAATKGKVLILLSDGESNAGVVEPIEAAKAAKALGVKAYAIGIGTTGVAPFPAEDAFGRRTLVPQQVRIDEETLRKIAAETGGRYFHAKTTEGLEEVYAEIDRLEKTPTEGRLYTEYRELYALALLPGLGLFLLELLLSATRFRTLP